MLPSHYYSLKVLERHLDTFGHVNNAVYLEILEEARWDWITGGGYGLKKIEETGKGPTIVQITIQFKKELTLHQEIQIISRVTSYKRRIGTIQQVIMAGETLAASAELTIGLFDTHTRRLIAPTNDWLKALAIPAIPYEES